MTAIKMHPSDIRLAKALIYQVALSANNNFVIKKVQKINFGDKKRLIAEFAKRIDKSPQVLSNMLTETDKAAKLSDDVYNLICEEFGKCEIHDEGFKKNMTTWIQKQGLLFEERKPGKKTNIRVIDSAITDSINTLDEYFSRDNNSLKSLQEYEAFSQLKEVTGHRKQILKLVDDLPDETSKIQTDVLEKKWAIFEKVNEQIIVRSLNFTELFDGFAFTRLGLKLKFYYSESGEIPYGHPAILNFLYSQLELRVGELDPGIYVVYNFSFKDSVYFNDRFVGHKLTYKKNPLKIDCELAIIEEVKDGDFTETFQNLSHDDKRLSDFVKAAFSDLPELTIEPHPLKHMNASIKYLMSR